MAAAKSLILITGGNSGIGLSLATLLLADPTKHVLLGCRSVEKGSNSVANLKSLNLPGTVDFLHIDVSSQESISSAAQFVKDKFGHLDVIVNNAAIGTISKGDETNSLTSRMLAAYQTNTIGPLLTVEAFLPLLRASNSTPRIINVTSGAGLMSHTLNPASPNLGLPGIAYSASKAALNLITGQQIRDYGPEGIKVFGYTPGFVVSGLGPMNNKEGGAEPTEFGARPMVAIVNGDRDGEHGMLLRREVTSSW